MSLNWENRKQLKCLEAVSVCGKQVAIKKQTAKKKKKG